MSLTHNPRVGRHGLLLEMKDDTTRCMFMRRTLNTPDYPWRNAEHRDRVKRMSADENDMCPCHVSSVGGVWSRMMSSLPESAEENVQYYFGHPTNTGRLDEYEQREMDQTLVYEGQLSELYMEKDISLASGETYRRLM